MAGTGIITVRVLLPDRATWDSLVTAVQTFEKAHPEIQSITFQYREDTTT